MFDINSAVASYTTPDLLAVIVLGVIGGIFGSLYNYLVDKVLRTYSIINEYALVIFLLITRILLVSFVTKFQVVWLLLQKFIAVFILIIIQVLSEACGTLYYKM